MIVEIIVPQGTKTVRFRDIPELFATARHPAPPADSPRTVTEVKKIATSKENAQQWCGANMRPFPVSLTEDDLSTLHATCWQGLPPLELPIPVEEWLRYQMAFDQSRHDGWEFFAVTVDPVLNGKVMRHHLVDEYLKQITSAARSGELTVRSANTLLPCADAIGERLLDCLVSVDDLRSYAATLQFEIKVSSAANPPVPARPEVQVNGAANAPDDEEIPGALPRVSVGRLAVQAAWQIERATGRRAEAKDVMQLLQQWAKAGEKPDVLKEPKPKERSVVWITSKLAAKDYSLEACEKTLSAWNQSRG